MTFILYRPFPTTETHAILDRGENRGKVVLNRHKSPKGEATKRRTKCSQTTE